MISGMVILSNAELGCYPYKESIRSFLPVVDELVVVVDVLSKDGTWNNVENMKEPKVRIVPSAFNLFEWGWIGYGIMRTTGYQACNGEIILMFDGDGVLHEKDYDSVKRSCSKMLADKRTNGYWDKHRIYKTDLYHEQFKHSGIYNKGIMGDLFDFFNGKKGIPNFNRFWAKHPGYEKQRSFQFPVKLFGYEHLWDTEECIRRKVNTYGRMIDAVHAKPFKTPEEYYDNYRAELIAKLETKGKKMALGEHPAIMRKKLSEINENHFGYNFFS